MEGDQGIVVSDKETEGRIHEFGGMVQMLNAHYDKAFDSFQVLSYPWPRGWLQTCVVSRKHLKPVQ